MATTTITLNLRKRLLKVHLTKRRMRVPTYTKEAIARFAKVDVDKIRIDANLNRHLIVNVARKPLAFKVTLEKTEDKVMARLHGAPKAEAAKPEAKAEKGKEAKPAAQRAEAKKDEKAEARHAEPKKEAAEAKPAHHAEAAKPKKPAESEA